MKGTDKYNEQTAAAAFDKQSVRFDDLYATDTIIRYKRKRVRHVVSQYIKAGSRILELNAGTGEDAVYFAGLGHCVHATDISAGMLAQLSDKVRQHRLSSRVTCERCSFTELEKLEQKGPYDLIFSNFAGLNCTRELSKVLNNFPALLKQDGVVVLVLLPPFCLWESLLLFRGKFRTATRRLLGRKGAVAHIEGEYFKCRYYNPSYIISRLQGEFDLLCLEGLCTLVPPSYMEHFAERHPGIYRFFERKEERLKDKWPWKYWGDYFIIALKRKAPIRYISSSRSPP